MRVGSLELRVPRRRDSTFETAIFDRYQCSETALVLAMTEMVINGVSTRKVKRITDELCGQEFSKSTVSRLCERLDERVDGWAERTLEHRAAGRRGTQPDMRDADRQEDAVA
jgi:transposase-like protein